MSDIFKKKSANLVDEEARLREVDLNLLIVFNTVMQLRNITRAANMLSMSQPAVSNSIARLKLIFNDDLFVRDGRGIRPTKRACQIYAPIRQALQLIMNELPGAGFDPKTSMRQFNVAISSPLDKLLVFEVLRVVGSLTSNVSIKLQSVINNEIEHQLRYQNIDFMISYMKFEGGGFCNEPLFNDELVLVSSKIHPRITPSMSDKKYLQEKHAVMMVEHLYSFSAPYYNQPELHSLITFQGTDLYNVMEVVSKTDMIALVPRSLAEANADNLKLSVIPLPWMRNQLTCYLSWHDSSSKDGGNLWLKSLLIKQLTSAY